MPEVIETARLHLRLRGPVDAAWSLELREESGHPDRRRSIEGEAEYLERRLAQARLDGFGIYTVRRRDTDEPVGYVGLVVGRSTADEPEVAYEMLRRAQSLGIATEATRAIVDAAFATGRGRLWATTRPLNSASMRVLDKLGFRLERSTKDAEGEVLWFVTERESASGG
jgi:RimJ/RimL family protein N-acetyltransferase